MRICCSTQLPFLSCNFNILKVFPKIFSTELTTTKINVQLKKTNEARKAKRRGEELKWKDLEIGICLLGMPKLDRS